VEYLDSWVEDDAPAVDADDDGFYDQGGPAIIEAAFEPLVLAVLDPVLGEQSAEVYEERGLAGDTGSSIVDKDLRTLLGDDVEGPFNLQYCGGGSLEQCQQDLWAVVDATATALAAEYGTAPRADGLSGKFFNRS